MAGILEAAMCGRTETQADRDASAARVRVNEWLSAIKLIDTSTTESVRDSLHKCIPFAVREVVPVPTTATRIVETRDTLARITKATPKSDSLTQVLQRK